MKNSATKIQVLLSVLLMLPVLTFSQNVPVSKEKLMSIHREVPDDPYLPNSFGNKKTSPAKSFRGTGFFMTQVNVDASGNNIIGDAANEPSLGVDPTNPDRMVIGWRQFDNISSNFRQAGYGFTTDAGQTWKFPGRIEEGIFRSDPVLDFDSAGFAYYNSLTSNSGTYTCKVFKSADGGAQWNTGTEARGGDKQWMTIDRSGSPGTGNIYSAWNSNYSSCSPGFFTRSTDAGNSFESCVEVSGYPYWGTMAVGNEGELYVAGAGDWSGAQVVKSSTAWFSGAPVSWDFSSPVDLDGYVMAGASFNPVGLTGQISIDVDRSKGQGNGNVYVLCSLVRLSNNDSADVMFARSTDGGVFWSDPMRINDDGSTDNFQWFGTLSVAPNGRIDAIWLDTRDAPAGTVMSALYYSYSTDQGTTWSVNERLSDLFDPHLGYPNQNKMGDYFDMRSDDNGAHLAWANTLNGEQDVYYSYITPDVTGIRNNQMNDIPVLLTSYPNPFSDHNTISYTLPENSYVSIILFDVYGKAIKTLEAGKKTAGNHHLEWTSDLSPGYYECRLTAGNQTKHVSLIKVK